MPVIIETQQGDEPVASHGSKSTLLRIAGWLMVLPSFLALVQANSLAWLLCPQALTVMFLRQSQHAYDSLGAPDYPDLAVGLLYYPFIGWILSRALRAGKLRPVTFRVGLWHIVAIGSAAGTCEMRNRLWGF